MELHFMLFILVLICAIITACLPGESMKWQNDTNPTQSSQFMTSMTQGHMLNKSGTCNLTVDESVLETLSRLTKDTTVNIVELRQICVVTEQICRPLSSLKWALANKVGREILWILKFTKTFDVEAIRTLTVGRRKLDVEVHENRKECMRQLSEKNVSSLLAKTLLYKPFRTSNTKYHLCYAEMLKMSGETDEHYTCYKIIGKGQEREYNLRSSYLTDTIIHYCIILTSVLFFSVLMTGVAYANESSRENNYYKITDSPMSLSSLFYFLFFEGYGVLKSFVRRCICVVLFTLFRLIFFTQIFLSHSGSWYWLIFDIWFIYWVCFFLLDADMFKRGKHMLSHDNGELQSKFLFLIKLFKFLSGFDVKDVFLSGSNYHSIVDLVTLLFNIKRWRSGRLKEAEGPEFSDMKHHKRIWLTLKTVLKAFCYLGYVCPAFLLLFLMIIIKLFIHGVLLSHIIFPGIARIHKVVNCILLIFIIFYGFHLIYVFSSIILLFFAGFIFNLSYFIPYITLISVLIFYTWTFWKTVEIQYFTLKMNIYEVYVCKKKIALKNADAGSVGVASGDDGVSADSGNVGSGGSVGGGGSVGRGGSVRGVDGIVVGGSSSVVIDVDGRSVHRIVDGGGSSSSAGGGEGGGAGLACVLVVAGIAVVSGVVVVAPGFTVRIAARIVSGILSGVVAAAAAGGGGSFATGVLAGFTTAIAAFFSADIAAGSTDSVAVAATATAAIVGVAAAAADGNGWVLGSVGGAGAAIAAAVLAARIVAGGVPAFVAALLSSVLVVSIPVYFAFRDTGGVFVKYIVPEIISVAGFSAAAVTAACVADGVADGIGGGATAGVVSGVVVAVAVSVHAAVPGPAADGSADSNNLIDSAHYGDDSLAEWKYNCKHELLISKQLYNKIREEILPYNVCLFDFSLNVLFMFLFAYIMFTMISILSTMDISGSFQVITTLSVSAVPYFFNMVATKISQEEKEVRNKVQKLKVEEKFKVEEPAVL